MLTPEELRDIADTMLPLLDDLHDRVLRDMMRRLMARLGRGERPMLTATDEWQLQVYQEAGGHLDTVRRLLRQFLDLSEAEVARIFEDAGIRSLDADELIYATSRGAGLALSDAMVQIMTDTYQRTNGTIRNLTRTTAEASQKALIQALDLAHWEVQTGMLSYTAAVREAVDALADTQLQVSYPSGHVDTIETAVLRAVRTGTAQTAGNVSLQGMIEHDWDLIRVSAHLGARYGDGGENPGNHFWWQGKLYSRTGNDPRYPPFVETTGYGTGEGLCGWNCRHSFGPGDPDHDPFQNYDAEENKKAYDLSQRQRAMERAIRRSKAKVLALREARDAAEDPDVKKELQESYTKAAKRLTEQNKAYDKFCEENGLKKLNDRIQVAKWNRSEAMKAVAAARKREKALADPQNDDTIKTSELPLQRLKSVDLTLRSNAEEQALHMEATSGPDKSYPTTSQADEEVVASTPDRGIIKSMDRLGNIGTQFFAEKGLAKQDARSLEKGIRTLEKRIQEHEGYLEDPRTHVPDWDDLTEHHQASLIQHWRKEIRNFRESIQDREDELRKRGESGGRETDG